MDLVNVLHMNGGDRECSYADNSIFQKNLMLGSRKVLEDTIKKYGAHGFSECFKLADLGCSSGPNASMFVANIVEIVHAVCQKNNLEIPEFQVFLNDLPSNDFNTLFRTMAQLFSEKVLEKNVNCFISGVAGSFYTRLFPSKSLHFIHSSTSVHWLSQVPQNLVDHGNIYMATSSPRSVYEAYFAQFKKDFTTFLHMRSEEIIPNGRMVLTLPVRSSADPTIKDGYSKSLGLLGKSLVDMSAKGLLNREDVTSFNLPLYFPCTDELEEIIESESSFSIDRLETYEVKWDMREEDEIIKSGDSSGKFIARIGRAVTESMLASHFGSTYMDEIFERYAMLVDEHLSQVKTDYFFSVVISLIRK